MSSPLNLTSGSSSSRDKVPNYKVLSGRNVTSIFGNAQFSPFPTTVDPSTGNVTGISSPNSVHNDDSYNISISDIVDYTSKHKSMKLSFHDFAYLKNVGVFPNNRLIVARRFASGVGNDLTSIQSEPLSTLISWVPDGADFIDVSYSENWEQSEASFSDVLTDIGKNITASLDQKGTLGVDAGRMFNAIALPGFMDGIQYEVLNKMGITEAGIGNSPLGNPNLIRKSMRRSTVEPEKAGTGLEASFSVKMTVEYEQKYIQGVDPSLVYLDILQNALTFGTSDASFQFNSAFASGSGDIIKDIISGDIKAIGRAIEKFVTILLDALHKIALELKGALAGIINPPTTDNQNKTDIFDRLINFVGDADRSTIGHVVSIYKVRLIGIVNSLTGTPSTPWHITIGNPKRPLFSSGDMLCKDVSLTLGKSLSFNDLPSYIKIEFTLTNARPLGAQEIFNRFNTGRGRSYARINKSYVEVADMEESTTSTSNTTAPNTTTSNTNLKTTSDFTGQSSVVNTPTGKKEVVKDKYLVDPEVDYDNSGYTNQDNASIGDPVNSNISDNSQIQPSNQSNPSLSSSVTNIGTSTSQLTETPGSVTLLQQEKVNVNGTVVNRDDLSKLKGSDTKELEDRSKFLNGKIANVKHGSPEYFKYKHELELVKKEQKNRTA